MVGEDNIERSRDGERRERLEKSYLRGTEMTYYTVHFQ